ncbi:MAG: FAD-dependent thymidylate synthase [Candidatus Eremiobacteraeota bacterium]|nr:FAD-dependent thymidylate synthase [Candidatus Eremiobacteraeota bacterium]
MPTRLIWITPDAERLMGYCARVSNPENQENPNVAQLLRFCIKNGHWSVFEMADMCIEMQTTRGISAQITRHRSFHFQEFSQRYAAVQRIEEISPRRQDLKNRQSSHDDLPQETLAWFAKAQEEHFTHARKIYDEALEKGIAKESARFLLPMASGTTIYMKGTVRDWVHYIALRSDPGTQLEHRELALGCKAIFVEQLPMVAEALGWHQAGAENGTTPARKE